VRLIAPNAEFRNNRTMPGVEDAVNVVSRSERVAALCEREWAPPVLS
jgi:hypothetical protein